MPKSFNIAEFKQFIGTEAPFTIQAFNDYFKRNGEDLSASNLKVRVNRLKKKGLIINIGRGWYKLNDKTTFMPAIKPSLKKIATKVKKEFPYLTYLVWSGTWLNPMTNLYFMKDFNIVEVESGSEEAVFEILKELYPDTVFIDPDENQWSLYISGKEAAIIVKQLISESPQQPYNGIRGPKLEKILVDLYCDKLWELIFSAEIENIYREVCTNYLLNFSTLLSYAARRNKRNEIREYIIGLNVLDNRTMQLLN